ncbi:MAG: GAF domain-containing protein [Proteobacteria bacterium]|nr:GAF domain-containing protein [Pseudomonadota bacterium]
MRPPFKKTGKGPWSERVLDQGLPYIGSDESDIRQVFSEADLLIAKGLYSVLNIPIWYSGDVIGSLNLLHHRKAYDGVDDRWIWLMSSICTPIFVSLQNFAKENTASLDISTLDSV